MGRSLHREVKIERLGFGIINFMSRLTVRLVLAGFCPQLYNEGVFVRKSPHVDHFCLQSSSRRPFPSTIVSKHVKSGPNTL